MSSTSRPSLPSSTSSIRPSISNEPSPNVTISPSISPLPTLTNATSLPSNTSMTATETVINATISSNSTITTSSIREATSIVIPITSFTPATIFIRPTAAPFDPLNSRPLGGNPLPYIPAALPPESPENGSTGIPSASKAVLITCSIVAAFMGILLFVVGAYTVSKRNNDNLKKQGNPKDMAHQEGPSHSDSGKNGIYVPAIVQVSPSTQTVTSLSSVMVESEKHVSNTSSAALNPKELNQTSPLSQDTVMTRQDIDNAHGFNGVLIPGFTGMASPPLPPHNHTLPRLPLTDLSLQQDLQPDILPPPLIPASMSATALNEMSMSAGDMKRSVSSGMLLNLWGSRRRSVGSQDLFNVYSQLGRGHLRRDSKRFSSQSYTNLAVLLRRTNSGVFGPNSSPNASQPLISLDDSERLPKSISPLSPVSSTSSLANQDQLSGLSPKIKANATTFAYSSELNALPRRQKSRVTESSPAIFMDSEDEDHSDGADLMDFGAASQLASNQAAFQKSQGLLRQPTISSLDVYTSQSLQDPVIVARVEGGTVATAEESRYNAPDSLLSTLREEDSYASDGRSASRASSGGYEGASVRGPSSLSVRPMTSTPGRSLSPLVSEPEINSIDVHMVDSEDEDNFGDRTLSRQPVIGQSHRQMNDFSLNSDVVLSHNNGLTNRWVVDQYDTDLEQQQRYLDVTDGYDTLGPHPAACSNPSMSAVQTAAPFFSAAAMNDSLDRRGSALDDMF